MVGTFLPWMGSWMLANHTVRNGRPAVMNALVTTLLFTLLVGTLAVLLGFPGAAWTLGTFAVAVLPGLALATILSAVGKRRT
jgi:hypothetical protein